MNILEWFLSFFRRKKEKKEEKSDKKRKKFVRKRDKEETTKLEEKEELIFHKEEPINSEKPIVQDKNPSILEIIEIEREKSKKRKEFYVEGNEIILPFLGLKFIFCKSSWKKFNEEFKGPEWEIDYEVNDGYILRKSGMIKEYFHVWLKKEEIEDFMYRRNCTKENVQVHHINHIRRDNRIINLKVMSKVEHREHHKKERAYQKWIGSRGSFENWWFEHHKEERDPTAASAFNTKLDFS